MIIRMNELWEIEVVVKIRKIRKRMRNITIRFGHPKNIASSITRTAAIKKHRLRRIIQQTIALKIE